MRTILRSDSPEGQELVADINAFCQAIDLDRATGGRHSLLLMLDLYFGAIKQGNINPAKILAEIHALEAPNRTTRTKPATPFTGPLLGGLWHKHHLESGISSFARNLQKGLHIYGIPSFEQSMREAEEANEERYVTKEDIYRLAQDVSFGNYERLADDSKLTGEWIIFAKHEGKNYYLCLGRHDSGDAHIRAQIEAACFAEFPFLKDILTPQPSA